MVASDSDDDEDGGACDMLRGLLGRSGGADAAQAAAAMQPQPAAAALAIAVAPSGGPGGARSGACSGHGCGRPVGRVAGEGAEDDGGDPGGRQLLRRFGRGRHGPRSERLALALHMVSARQRRRREMHSVRAAKQIHGFLLQQGVLKRTAAAARLDVVQGKRLKPTKRARHSCRVSHLKLILRTPAGQRQPIQARQLLEIGFATRYSVKAMAEAHGVSPRSVQRCTLASAMAYMRCQRLMLDRLAEALERNKPSYVIVHELWDETGERLTMKVPELTNRRAQTTVEVFVARVAVTLGWHGHRQPVTVELVVPPGYVQTPSSASLFHALFGGPFTGPVQAALRRMLGAAKIPMILDECDAASGNDKMHAFLLSLDPPGVLREQLLCGLHQTHLVVTSTIQALGTEIVSRMYSTSLALRTHGYFLRLHAVCRQVLEKGRFLANRAPRVENAAEAKEHAAELMHYLLVHDASEYESADNVAGAGRVFKGAWHTRLAPEDLLTMTPSDLKGRQRASVLARALTLLALVTGPLWQGTVFHDCSGACGGHDCLSKVDIAIRDLLLRRLPAVPVSSRWTKVGSCLDFLVGGILFCGMLPALFEAGFGSVTARQPMPAHQGAADMDVEELQAQQWHVVTGSRITKARQFLSDKHMQTKMLILAVVLEPLRCLTTYLLAASREVQDINGVPKFYDSIEPARSIFIVCSQYLSSLLRGRGARLALVFRHAGQASFDEWCHNCPRDVELLQVAVSAASSWVWRRHVRRFAQHPLRILGVGDLRAPHVARASLVDDFSAAPACCHRPGFARRLRQQNPTVEDMLSDEWAQAAQAAARQVRMGIACIEWRHAWNRQHASAGTSWHQFGASYTTREALYLLKARKQRAKLAAAGNAAGHLSAVDGAVAAAAVAAPAAASPLEAGAPPAAGAPMALAAASSTSSAPRSKALLKAASGKLNFGRSKIIISSLHLQVSLCHTVCGISALQHCGSIAAAPNIP